jgi:predicted lipoprotein with Yx(FWY)xxD motif
MRFPQVLGLAAVGVIALAACGSGGGSSNSAGSYGAPVTSPPPAVAQAATGSVHTGQTKLGTVLVDANGHTLYGFTSDTNGMSNCNGSCTTVWPPVTVSGPTLPANYDAKVFSVVMRGDGTYQLRAGKWPLYRFASDAAPGDANGQGVNGFFVVQPTGALNKA